MQRRRRIGEELRVEARLGAGNEPPHMLPCADTLPAEAGEPWLRPALKQKAAGGASSNRLMSAENSGAPGRI
jgi:hypothetical protein